MIKFKVGDKVRAAASTNWWRKGDVGIITRIDHGFRVDFEDGESDGESWWFCNDEGSEFELVEPKSIAGDLLKTEILRLLDKAGKQPKKETITLINDQIDLAFSVGAKLVYPKVHITGGGTGGGASAGRSGGITLGHGSSRLADALKKDMLLGISGDSVTIYPNPPHKHQIEIIAWANGAVIEFYHDIMGWTSIKHPSWAIYVTYRVKPTKTPLQIEIEELEAKLVKLKGQL